MCMCARACVCVCAIVRLRVRVRAYARVSVDHLPPAPMHSHVGSAFLDSETEDPIVNGFMTL